MTNYPKRLIEVDLPIKRISAHALREKNVRQGHISALHIWWARRPLAACRAVICAALWFDPTDAKCPPEFRNVAREQMRKWARDSRGLMSAESYAHFESYQKDPSGLEGEGILRTLLLDFIADFANWDNSTKQPYLETSRALTEAAHVAAGGETGTRPLVVDPFAGGGAIPLEALRVGADAFASDLNPVAVMLNKIVLEYIPRYGKLLPDEVRKWGAWVKEQADKELREFYPKYDNGANAIAYIWARTILSEAPSQDIPVEVPLIKSMWLAQKGRNSVALRWQRDAKGNVKTEIVEAKYADGSSVRVRRPLLEVIVNARSSDIGEGTVRRGAATCPVTGYTTPVQSVRTQLRKRQGGSTDARLYVVVLTHPEYGRRYYETPTLTDLNAVDSSRQTLLSKRITHDEDFPIEELPNSASGYIAPPTYGARSFSDLFNARQLIFARWLVDSFERWCTDRALKSEIKEAVRCCIALVINRLIDSNSSQCWWVTIHGETVMRTFGRQAYPIVWDFAEINPLASSSRGIEEAVDVIASTLEYNSKWEAESNSHAAVFAAQNLPLPDDACAALITDPPYYNAIPYSDLADFYYVWLSRLFVNSTLQLFSKPLSSKDEEIVEMSGWDSTRFSHKTKLWYETEMARALERARSIVSPSGVMVLIFAHKETSAWEALLSAIVTSGWTITGSWPIDTENARRLRAQQSATLASSVHLICRPRENVDGSLRTEYIGDWRDVLRELPIRIHEWMPRLAKEGVVGADAIFACLGPALEVFSRYSRVEKASGEQVTLREYLEYVWAAVAKEALNMIFRGADATGFEEDARLTAMWLWTLSPGPQSTNGSNKEEEIAETKTSNDDDEDSGKAAKTSGFVLEYDAARKIAQGLGAHLEELSSLVEVKGDKARLLPVAERTSYLFGKADAEAPANRRKKKAQAQLFEELEEPEDHNTWGAKGAPVLGDTALDRIHQSMILFAAGRSEALRRFLVEDGAGTDERFWRLANALSALYPTNGDEKRWVDGVLAKKKSFGF